MPELRLVVLALQDRLAYGPTFEPAMTSLFGGAVSSLSAGKGVVRTVDSSGRHASILVSLGEADDRFVEITGGLDPSAWVLTRNPRFLRDDDKIRITRIMASQN